MNNNGVVSFGMGVPEFTPEPFPLPGHRPFVAPYWADVDIRLGGDVFYRQSRQPALLARLARDLAPAVAPSDPAPQPTWAFVATWNRVAFFGAAVKKVGRGGPPMVVASCHGVTCSCRDGEGGGHVGMGHGAVRTWGHGDGPPGHGDKGRDTEEVTGMEMRSGDTRRTWGWATRPQGQREGHGGGHGSGDVSWGQGDTWRG